MQGRDASARPDWTPRALAAAAFAFVYLFLQVVVPLVALGESRPARFGWQMYSGAGHVPSVYAVVREDGTRTEYDAASYVGYPRADVRFDDHLPGFLCATHPQAVTVLTLSPDGQRVEEAAYRC